MNVVFATVPMPAKALLPNGTIADGVLHFEARVFEPGEPGSIWEGGRAPATAKEWLAQANGDRVFVLAPKAHAGAPPVGIPAAVLRTLSPETAVSMEWWWEIVR